MQHQYGKIDKSFLTDIQRSKSAYRDVKKPSQICQYGKQHRRESAAMGGFRAKSACFLGIVTHIDIFGVFEGVTPGRRAGYLLARRWASPITPPTASSTKSKSII
ncbi:MAG: hypothetical protein RSD94_12125 [Acinetobacter sp.]